MLQRIKTGKQLIINHAYHQDFLALLGILHQECSQSRWPFALLLIKPTECKDKLFIDTCKHFRVQASKTTVVQKYFIWSNYRNISKRKTGLSFWNQLLVDHLTVDPIPNITTKIDNFIRDPWNRILHYVLH